MSNPLPLPLIETLWAQLITTWGQEFLRQYGGVDLEVVKNDWAWKLGPFYRLGANGWGAPAIDYALDILPERPCNVIVFRQLCNRYSGPSQLSLPGPAPTAMSDGMRKKLDKLKEPVSDEPDRVRWARRYVAMWGNDRKLIARRQTDLNDAKRIIEMYEEDLEQARRTAAAAQVPA